MSTAQAINDAVAQLSATDANLNTVLTEVVGQKAALDQSVSEAESSALSAAADRVLAESARSGAEAAGQLAASSVGNVLVLVEETSDYLEIALGNSVLVSDGADADGITYTDITFN